MKNLHWGITLFFLALIPLFTFAQNTLTGRVLDDQGQPLHGATVIIKDSNNGAVTDALGQFNLSTQSSFPFEIEVSYVGFDHLTFTVENNLSQDYRLSFSNRFDEIIVSASRKAEKLQEAPAAVSVISAKQVSTSGGAISPIRALINSPGVELQQQTGQRINIALRGANGIFSTNVFPLLDYRSLITPGLEYFDSQNSPINPIDLERIEVVLGPGSALYGPDVTTGVIHFISKTPFKHPGTTLELIYGERNTFRAGIRHAGKNEKETFGYKFNLRYSSGKDFTLDPNNAEDSQILADFKTSINRATISAEGNVDTSHPGTKLFDISPTQKENYWAALANASLYFRPENGMEIVTAGGWNAGNAIFYNDLGEGQAFGNEYWGQARFSYKGWFAQTYFIKNDGGNDEHPNYLNRTGFITPLERTHYEAQLQYNFDWPGLLDSEWTTGVDYRTATANTENHVYGRNEEDDDYRILGGYLQGKFKLDPKLDLFIAGRYDGYNFTDEKTFSPRAAFVYKPSDQHNIRITYNRAANPIAASDIYFDLPTQSFGIFDAWVFGAKTPYSFGNNPTISWLIPGVPNTPVAAGFPLAAAFAAVNQDVINGIVDQLQQSAQFAPLIPLAQNILSTPGLVPSDEFTPVQTLSTDGTPLAPVGGQGNLLSFLTSYELGYKGVVGNRFSFGLDVYHFRRKGGATFRQITPVVSIENLPENLGQTVQNNTQNLIEQGLIDLGSSPATAATTAAALAQQVNTAYTQGGELFLQSLAQAGLPFHGIVQINENSAAVPRLTLGYLSIDETVVNEDWGAEFNFKFFATEELGVQGNYTWFALDKDNPGDAAFPTHKVRLGLNYDPTTRFDASLNYQWDDGFKSNSPVFPGTVPARHLVDLTLGLELGESLRFELAAINLFNKRFRALPGFPRLGRTVTGRLVMNLN